MEEIYTRTKKLKMETLDILEERIKQKPSNEDLLFISKIINEVEEDKSFYSRTMNKLYNEGTAFGFNGNYNPEKTEAK